MHSIENYGIKAKASRQKHFSTIQCGTFLDSEWDVFSEHAKCKKIRSITIYKNGILISFVKRTKGSKKISSITNNNSRRNILKKFQNFNNLLSYYLSLCILKYFQEKSKFYLNTLKLAFRGCKAIFINSITSVQFNNKIIRL